MTPKLKKLALFSAATLITCSAQNVFAHAGLKDAITEGTVSTWNAVRITHGCNSNVGGEGNGLPHKDVIALSVVFPNSTDITKSIMRRSKTGAESAPTVGQEPTLPNLANDLVGSTASIGLSNSLSTIMSGPTMFVNNKPVVDSLGTVRGWQSWAGPRPFNGPALLESAKKPDGKDISTNGIHEFGISKFQFKPTSCAKYLKIRLAIANWCAKGADSYNQADRADIWIGSKTNLFNDDVVMPNEGSNPIFWTTLSVNRDLVANPLPGSTSQYPSSTIPPTTDSTSTSGTAPNRVYTSQYAATNVDPALAGKIITTYEAYPNVTTTNNTLKGVTTVANTNTACNYTASGSDYDTVYIEPSNDDIDALLPISKEPYPAGAGDLYWPTAGSVPTDPGSVGVRVCQNDKTGIMHSLKNGKPCKKGETLIILNGAPGN